MDSRADTLIAVFIFCLCLLWPGLLLSDTLKTTQKRYTIRSYKGKSILCEPYGVNKDEWLYKIFRKKGAISEKDFPLFLTIFKVFNPWISNIDSIQPGQEILIPLKMVNSAEYQGDDSGIIHVPLLEFSSPPDILRPYIKKTRLSSNGMVSQLLDPVFLNKDNTLTTPGKKALILMNPGLKNVEFIDPKKWINLPDPSLLAQPWFRALLPDTFLPDTDTLPEKLPPPEKKLSPLELNQYATLIGGKAQQQGMYHFPQPGGGKEVVLDLKTTPLILLNTGEHILILNDETPPKDKTPLLLNQIKPHWPNLVIMNLKKARKELAILKESTAHNSLSETATIVSLNPEALTQMLMQRWHIDYIPQARIPFSMAGLKLEAILGRVILKNRSDLLLNFGSVHGRALKILKNQGFDICSFSIADPPLETIRTLLNKLGATLAFDPVFISPKTYRTITIPGLYADWENQRLFVTQNPINNESKAFLDTKDIRIIYLAAYQNRL